MVVGGSCHARRGRQAAGQQAALQGGDQIAQPFPVAFGGLVLLVGELARSQQFLFVGAPVAGIEDDGADQMGLTVIAGLDGGGDQHRQPPAVFGPQFQGDPGDLALKRKQRRIVRLVVELAAHGQQVGEPAAADELVAGVAEPLQQGGIDFCDSAVEQRGQVPARGVFVKVVDVVLEHRRHLRAGGGWRLGRLAGHADRVRNSLIAEAVTSGALSWGQCPVAGSVTSRLSWICSWT